MNTIKTVVTMIILAMVSGCMSMPSLDRPLPPEPAVSGEAKQALSGKAMQDFPIYVAPVSEMTFYDPGDFKKFVDDGIREGKDVNKLMHFTQIFPKQLNPPATTVAAAEQFLATFKEKITKKGFTVVDYPCDECLTMRFDFARYANDDFHWQVMVWCRPKIYYRQEFILETRDDLFAGSLSYQAFTSWAISNLSDMYVKETLNVWNKVMHVSEFAAQKALSR